MTRAAIFAPLCATLLMSAAYADSALQGGPRPGTETNPGGMIPDLPRDPLGLATPDDVSRTPTGLLYPLPPLYPAMIQDKADPDWWSSKWIDAGMLGTFGNTHSAQFRQYGDWNNGPLISSAGFLTENRKTAFYASGDAQDVGRDDQTYQLKLGRYGVFDVTLFFDATPHLLSTTAKSLWDGVGSGNLTLKGGLVAGASTAAQVTNVLAATAPSDLKITRDKAGFNLRYKIQDDLEAFFQVSNEWRDGTKPLGGTFAYPFQNGATEVVEPIHYTTLDVTAALRYSGEESEANLTYVGSIFRDELQSLTWQNPGLSGNARPGVFVPPLGRLSLPPSNEYHSLKADFAEILAPELRLSGNLTFSIMRQNDALLPPTADSGTIPGLATSINLSQWNSVAALSMPHAHAAIDTFRAFAQLEYTPASDWTLDITLKDNSEDNRTNYVAFNPLTGQYGYIAIDGGLAPFSPGLSGVYEPGVPGSVVQIRNIPFANDNLELDAKAAWRLSSHMKLDATYTHNTIRHTAREVPDADDNRFSLQWAWTGNKWGTLRASYEYARLSGSDYTSNPYTPYYSTALPGYVPQSAAGDAPFTLSALRKFDVGNRTEHTMHLQSNFVLSARSDLQFGNDVKIDTYDTLYGLRSANRYDFNGAFAYQLSSRTTFNGFANYEFQEHSVAGINPSGNGGVDASAGGPNYPLANGWYQNASDHDATLGASLHQAFDTITLDLNYTFTATSSSLRYYYASAGAFFNSLSAAQAGSQFPNTDFTYHMLEGNLRWQYSSAMAIRLYYRLDYRNLNDFHYTGLSAAIVNHNTYLGVVPENYTAQAIGTFVQYTF